MSGTPGGRLSYPQIPQNRASPTPAGMGKMGTVSRSSRWGRRKTEEPFMSTTAIDAGPITGERPVTVPEFRSAKARAAKLAVVTAYDYTSARLTDEAGVDAVLVGDSLGMVVQGQPTSLPVTLRDVIYHTRCVVRGVKRALVVTDLPFLTYQVSPRQAVKNAGRLMKEAGAHAVKLEGGVRMADTIRAVVNAGIPVMGHIGLTPQSVHLLGGFKVQ